MELNRGDFVKWSGRGTNGRSYSTEGTVGALARSIVGGDQMFGVAIWRATRMDHTDQTINVLVDGKWISWNEIPVVVEMVNENLEKGRVQNAANPVIPNRRNGPIPEEYYRRR